MPGISRSSSKERTWRPNALRLQSVSMQPRCSRSSMIIPAQVPSTGRPDATNARSGSAEPFALDAERHRRRLAARHHQPVEPLEVGGHADLAHFGAEAPQHLRVCFEVALECQDADEGHQPRLASSWPSSSLRDSSDCIAMPRPSEAEATRAASR